MNLKQAKAEGAKRYQPDRPCKNGHTGERQVSNRMCLECESERRSSPAFKAKEKQYRLDNADHRKAQQKEYYALNRDKRLSYLKTYRENNREKRAEWCKANRWRLALYRFLRRPGMSKYCPEWSRDLTNFVMSECRQMCLLREAATGVRWQVDHLVPLKGHGFRGLHVWYNLEVVPAYFNWSKNNRHISQPLDWIKS